MNLVVQSSQPSKLNSIQIYRQSSSWVWMLQYILISGKETQQIIWPLLPPTSPHSDSRLNQHLNSFQDQQFQNMQFVTFRGREGGRWGEGGGGTLNIEDEPADLNILVFVHRPASSLSSSEWRIPDVGQSDFILISGSGQCRVSPLACHTNPIYQLQIHSQSDGQLEEESFSAAREAKVWNGSDLPSKLIQRRIILYCSRGP